MVMGVVNVTPDSFSDGGQYFGLEKAVAHAEKLASEGAEIIDVGGESTQPGAKPVDEAEELSRVIPVIKALKGRIKLPISIDTMKPGVARAALIAGASVVNDVAANREDAEMWDVVAEHGAGYVLMHMQGNPVTMQKKPSYTDLMREVREFFEDRLDRLRRAGVGEQQVILDVGIGFGKTLEHNLQLLAGLNSFTFLDRPLMVGVSRKSFIGKICGGSEDERLYGGLACSVMAAESGVRIFRSHDVRETVMALRMAEAVLARKKT